MTDYPSIKPEDVREGDVVRGIYTYNYGQRIAVEGEVISKGSRLRIGAFLIRADLTDLRLVSRPTPPEPPCPFSVGETVYVKGLPMPLTVAAWDYYPAWGKWMVRCEDGTQGGGGELAYSLHPPLELTSSPPEPLLRVGDFVKGRRGHFEGQIVCVTDLADHSPYCVGGYWYESDELRRIEPPVGWPVGVPDPDAPGGVEWYRCTGGDEYYVGSCSGVLSWSELVAAGGVPALAVTR